jgi:hypothetical protein
MPELLPDLFACGCSRLKVSAGLCDLFASDGSERAYPADLALVCRECGCTDDDACLDEDGGPCSWVEANLCSACAPRTLKGTVPHA